MRTTLLLSLLALVAVGLWMQFAHSPDADLSVALRNRLAALPALPPPAAALTEADLAPLPAPVQRWLRTAGVLGQPPVRAVRVNFDATLYRAPGDGGMSGPATQIDFLAPVPRRLFHMRTRMLGLPVQVLHDWRADQPGQEATMRVRLAGLFNVADFSGPLLSATETVTLLNDLCAYAPSALADPAWRGALRWQPVDDTQARVSFTQGPHTVSALLTVDAAGHLVDFRSEDRGDVKANDRVERMPWTTPLSEFRRLDNGRSVPGRGDAVWHRADGPFVYGRFRVVSVDFDEAALR
ncbi:MAG: hypothetical protein IPG57_10855 [Burkholderiales bacterium]|jgi:hypothetical protein|nr:hypothetical protein [Burkholderiales bacterium]MBP7522074.1 hypothetical protein [Leptothrix sp. (in: b-proteobacteria)]